MPIFKIVNETEWMHKRPKPKNPASETADTYICGINCQHATVLYFSSPFVLYWSVCIK